MEARSGSCGKLAWSQRVEALCVLSQDLRAMSTRVKFHSVSHSDEGNLFFFLNLRQGFTEPRLALYPQLKLGAGLELVLSPRVIFFF